MQTYVDLHIHSKYSRATSTQLDLENLSSAAKVKGLHVLGTGDFTHPIWFKELKAKLEFDDGIYKYGGINFILTNEISLIYKQDKKQRRIHHILIAPDIDIVDQINEFLKSKGRVDYDGRPIFGFSSIELVDAMISISKDIMIIPAHSWTPWYGIFGSMSGFDSIEECFQDRSKYIYAIETGLSSNPEMNWRIPALDNTALVSFSDAHSAKPWRIGREACAFDLKKINYGSIMDTIKNNDPKRFLFTLEFFPEQGKYHYDGHRDCNFSCDPNQSKKMNSICPRCKQRLTIGVLNRIESLSDNNRLDGYVRKGAIPFKSIIPLSELIGFAIGYSPDSLSVWKIYDNMISAFGNELNILIDADLEEIRKVDEKVAELICRARNGKINFVAGYDGVYGKAVLVGENKIMRKSKNSKISDYVRLK